jgi:hypothetical protein
VSLRTIQSFDDPTATDVEWCKGHWSIPIYDHHVYLVALLASSVQGPACNGLMRPPAGVSVWHQVQCSRLLAPCTPSSRLARSQNVRATVYILAAPATASAADATSSGPVSTTAVHSGESSKASVLDQGLVHQAHDNTTIKQRRRSRKETSLLANTPADVQSDQNHTQTAEQQQQHRRRKNAKQTPPAVDDALVQTLISRTQLSQAAAQKIAAAKARGYGIPRDISKLCSNVQQLQQMLGAEYADLAITRFPSLVAYRWVPLNLFLSYQCAPSTDSSSPAIALGPHPWCATAIHRDILHQGSREQGRSYEPWAPHLTPCLPLCLTTLTPHLQPSHAGLQPASVAGLLWHQRPPRHEQQPDSTAAAGSQAAGPAAQTGQAAAAAGCQRGEAGGKSV